MVILVKDGIVITPYGKEEVDVYIEGETVKTIGKDLAGLIDKATTVIDAKGCYVLPGIIDPHVQLEGKYKNTEMTDDFYSGTKAAACGGITTIIDFAVQKQGGYSALEGLHQRRKQADLKVCTDYSLHVGITDPNDETIGEISQIINEGITSIKCYMTYRNRGRMVDEAGLYRVMTEAAKYNGLIDVHAENNTLVEYMTDQLVANGKKTSKDFPMSRTDIAEQVAVATALLFSRDTGCDLYIHHVTSKRVEALIREAKNQGYYVYGETCPQYLLLDDKVYQSQYGARFIMNPPIRDEESKFVLWDGLNVGSLDTVGTDHCSYTLAHKDEHKDDFTQVPAGVPGLETLLPLVYTYGVSTGRITIERLTEILSLNPAKIFGLYPQKGAIMPGADADLVIYDPSGESKINATQLHMNTDFNPFEGMAIRGEVKITMLRGNTIYRNGEFTGKRGGGKFIFGKRMTKND